MKSQKIYIYSLDCPITGEPKYIGKTKNMGQRHYSHLTSLKYTDKKSRWIKSLIDVGLEPVISIVEETTIDNADKLEKFYISLFLTWGFNLTNTQLKSKILKTFKDYEHNTVTITSNPELEKKVQEEGKREKRKFSAQIWYIVEKFFENKKIK